MKKQLLLLAIVGGALAVAAPQVQAQAPLPTTQFNPDAVVNATGNTANTITVSGIIPEFIQFTAIDNKLEFGDGPGGVNDMGGPLNTGLASSVPGLAGFVNSQGQSPSPAGSYIFPSIVETGPISAAGSLNQNPDGKAAVQFKSNAYIVLVSKADPMRNVGPDGLANTADDIVLTTGFIRRYRGSAAFYNNNTGTIGPGTTGLSSLPFTPSNGNANSTARGYNQSAVSNGTSGTGNYKDAPADGTLIDQIVYKPGSPFPAPYDSNGYWMAARVARHGLNDYRGDYIGKINLTYYKF